MTMLIPVLISFLSLAACSQQKEKLKFSATNTFTILQFTDLHFSKNDIEDLRTMAVIYKLTQKVKPDLVVFTGDLLSGNSDDCHEPELDDQCFQQAYNKYSLSMQFLNQKYAIVLGNHDDEANLNRRQILELDSMDQYSLTQQGPDGIRDGSNYYLPIYNKDNETDIQALLWMFDTNGYGCKDEEYSYGCVEQDQIDWFNKQNRQILIDQNKSQIQGIAFNHIPSPEYVDVVNLFGVHGNMEEDIMCPAAQNGFVDALMANNVVANFCGHDHDNDFNGIYEKSSQKIDLHYGRKTGYGYYGPPAGVKKGGKIITINSNGNSTFTYDVSIIEEGGNTLAVKLLEKRTMSARPCTGYHISVLLLIIYVNAFY